MTLKQDLELAVAKIFRESWTTRDGRVVPEPEQLKLGNDAVKLSATVLYADMADSTGLVNSQQPSFAAEVYKTYLTCAASIVKSEGGAITAYDGDRIMAVFVGDYKNTTATRCALRITGAVHDVINPALERQYPQNSYRVAHHVGVDTSDLFVARVGVRNDNDLVWVGRAANYAAKLAALNERNTVWVTDDVFKRLNDEAKYGGNLKQLMWQARTWTQMGNQRVHSSTWKWSV